MQHQGEIPSRSSTLNLVRLVAAYAVLFSHSFALLGLPQPQVAPGVDLGVFAVLVFFVISGYLVWISWERASSPASYAANRFLRIYPALAVNVLVTAIVLGPMLTTLSFDRYFGGAHFWQFLIDNLKPWGFYLHLPGVFESNPFPRTVNGSLWTISYEILMYAIVFGVGLLGAARKPALAWAVFALFAAMHVLLAIEGRWATLGIRGEANYMGFRFDYLGLLAPFFWSGALYAIHRHRIRLRGWIAALAAAAMLAASTSSAFVPVAWVALPYLVLYVGFAPPLQRMPESRNDYSYGVYLYAWPVQQVVVSFGMSPDQWALSLALTTVLTFALAMLSWHFVEARALALKKTFASLWSVRTPAAVPVHRGTKE